MKLTITNGLKATTIFFGAVMSFAGVLSGNGPGGGYSNAPSESNCTSCHGGTLNPIQANLNNLTLSAPFMTNGYLPDSTYTVTLSYSQSGINKFGFQITSLTQVGNLPSGTFTAGTGNSKVTANFAGRTREYIQHNSSGNTGSGSRSWSFTWKAPSTNQDTIVFYAVVNAADNNGGTGGDQIYAKTFKIPASSLLPVAQIQVSKSSVCVGDTVTYFGSGTNNPTLFRWKFQTGSPQIVTTQNVVRVYNNPGLYNDTLWVTNALGQSAPVRYQMRVLNAPQLPSISITPNDTACIGDSIILSTTALFGHRYQWNTTNPGDTFATLTVKHSGNYILTVTNQNGCTINAADNQLVFLNSSPPTLQVQNAADTLCFGDTLVYEASGNFLSYTYYVNGVFVQTTGSIFRMADVGTHIVSVEANNGYCVVKSNNAPAKTIVNRPPAPNIRCGLSSTTSVSFKWDIDPNATRYEVSDDAGASWQNIGLVDSFEVNQLNVDQEVRRHFRAIGNGVCADGMPALGICRSAQCSPFTFQIDVSDTLACAGDTITVAVNQLSLNNFFIDFNGDSGTTSLSYQYIPNSLNKEVTIRIFDLDASSCPPVSRKISVDYDSLPKPFVVSNPTNLCFGSPIELAAFVNATKYEFIVNQQVVYSGKDNRFNFLPPMPGPYQSQVRIFSANCNRISDKEDLMVYDLPKSGFTFTSNGLSVDFTDTTQNVSSRSWDFGDGNQLLNTSNNQTTHVYQNGGQYTVILLSVSSFGCTDSISKSVQVIGVGVQKPTDSWSIYPNPAKNELFITSDRPTFNEYQIIENTGKVLMMGNLAEATKIDVSNLAPGAYVLRLQHSDGSIENLKLLIQK